MTSIPSEIWNSTSARSVVPSKLHPSINQVLKDIKILLRRLQSTFATYSEEAQLLERIYYKGKNQHRTALFWRRVDELRKCCRRVSAFNVLPNLHSFRCSFFGPDATTNASQLKGSWTHLPDIKAVGGFMDKLTTHSCSLEKMAPRIQGAYQMFTISMQSAAFLQTLVVLASIACRLHSLSVELSDTIQELRLSCNQVLQVIKDTMEQPSQVIVAQLNQNIRKVPTQSIDFEIEDGIVSIAPKEQVERVIVKHNRQLNSSAERQQQIATTRKLKTPSDTKKASKKSKKPKGLDEIDAIFQL